MKLIFSLAACLFLINQGFSQDILIQLYKLDKYHGDTYCYFHLDENERKSGKNQVQFNGEIYQLHTVRLWEDYYSLMGCCEYHSASTGHSLSDYMDEPPFRAKYDFYDTLLTYNEKLIPNRRDFSGVSFSSTPYKIKGYDIGFAYIDLDFCICTPQFMTDFSTATDSLIMIKKIHWQKEASNLVDQVSRKEMKAFLTSNFVRSFYLGF